jgi:tetraacyldisaccharide 4'-kinase
MLRDQGLDIEEHPLPDHAVIAPDQLARADRKPALMTEKDAVKCADRLPDTWYVEVAAQVDGPGAARLPDRIMQLARQRHEGALTGG